jgi:hypothetical protein
MEIVPDFALARLDRGKALPEWWMGLQALSLAGPGDLTR